MNSKGPKVSKPSKGGGDKGLRNLVIGMLLFIVLVGVGLTTTGLLVDNLQAQTKLAKTKTKIRFFTLCIIKLLLKYNFL